MARLTIGMPVFNNARTVTSTVESLLAQTFADFRLVISDDNSTDETHAECERLVRTDNRIECVRQDRNLRYQNFGYLLRHAQTELFMWAPGDDRWSPDFVRACVRELDMRDDVVLAASRVQFEDGSGNAWLADGTYPLVGSCVENLYRYLSGPLDNSRMYGVFRTAPGKRSFPEQSFHAYDWAFSAATLRYGKHAEVPEVLMYRDKTPSENYVALVRSDTPTALGRLFPLLPMTRWLLATARIPRDRRVLGALLALNVEKHFEYLQRFHPATHRALRSIEAAWRTRVAWRLRAH